MTSLRGHERREFICSFCKTPFLRVYGLSKKRKGASQYCSRACVGAFLRSRKKPAAERFWLKVDVRSEDECWPWLGRRDDNDYGRFDNDGRPTTAHRFSFFDKSPHVDRRLHVCHSCDNPPCCNPKHLWAGTQLENIEDMNAKGRRRWGPPRRGPESNKTKLTEDQVREIVSSSMTNKELAAKFRVTGSAIYNVRHGKAWAHVTGICS